MDPSSKVVEEERKRFDKSWMDIKIRATVLRGKNHLASSKVRKNFTF